MVNGKKRNETKYNLVVQILGDRYERQPDVKKEKFDPNPKFYENVNGEGLMCFK